MRPSSAKNTPLPEQVDQNQPEKHTDQQPAAVPPEEKALVVAKSENQRPTSQATKQVEKHGPLSLRKTNVFPKVRAKVKTTVEVTDTGSSMSKSPRRPPPPPPPPPDDDRRKAHAQMMAARFNLSAETNELRTLLKLPRDTPSAQVIHKLRETFHLMDIVERFRSDLGRLLHTKEARTAEGALRAVQELLRENEQLRQQVDRQQDVVSKLQEDRRSVLERFHRLVRENRLKDYGSGSLLTLTGTSVGPESRVTSQETMSRHTAPAVSGSFGELTVSGTGEKKDLATMLSSRIDHLLAPKAEQLADNTIAEQQHQQQQQVKQLSPIYIRQKKGKDEKKLVYKITGIVRPTSSSSSMSSHAGGSRPRTMPTVAQSVPSNGKLPEIVAKRRTPTPTQRVRMLVEGESITRPASSLLSITEHGTTTGESSTTPPAPSTVSGSAMSGALPARRIIRTQGQRRFDDDRRRADANLITISKRYSSSAVSAAGSTSRQQPSIAASAAANMAPSSITEQDEQSIGDIFGSIGDVKKDDLVSLIFAPLLKDRYISRFSLSSQGGVLSIPEVGLSMVVPEGALPVGVGGGGPGNNNKDVEIVLGVSYNPADTPTVGASQIVPCPTILCATRPQRLHFRRPIVLAFAHNGGGPVLTKTRSTPPKIVQSLTEIGHVTKWEGFSNVDDDRTEDGQEQQEEFGCVNGEHCVLYVNQLRLFSLVSECGKSGVKTATKHVRMVVFVSYSPGRDCVALNVYCTDSLPSERQLLRRECLLDGTGVEVGEQPMIMYANSGDLLVSIRNVPMGWKLNGQSHQSLSYRKSWNNLHPHVTFVVECAPDTWESELTCSVHAQQVNANDTDAAADIHVCCDLAQMEGCSDGSLFDNTTSTSGLRSFLRGQSGGMFSPSIFDTGGSLLLQDADVDSVATATEDIRTLLLYAAWPRVPTSRHIPEPLVRQLASTLDPPNLLGLDWRQLAAELNLDACIPHLTAAKAPTELLLAGAELLCAGLYELEAVMERMGREDAAALVRAYRARSGEADLQNTNNKGAPVTARF